jgi:hypothetical protein
VSKLEIRPGTLDLALYGGDDSQIVVNLTNAAGEAATIDGTLKATVYVPYGLPSSYTPTITAGTITGQFLIVFSSTITRAIAGQGSLPWDLQIHQTSGTTRTILKGLINVSVEITND